MQFMHMNNSVHLNSPSDFNKSFDFNGNSHGYKGFQGGDLSNKASEVMQALDLKLNKI